VADFVSKIIKLPMDKTQNNKFMPLLNVFLPRLFFIENLIDVIFLMPYSLDGCQAAWHLSFESFFLSVVNC